jgi:hypothetical protein
MLTDVLLVVSDAITCLQTSALYQPQTITLMMMNLKAIFLALIALVSSVSANLELLAPVAQLQVNFVPKAVAPFSSKNGKLFVTGTCDIDGNSNGKSPCSLEIKDLKAERPAARHSNLRRALQADQVICDLVTITIGAVNINVAGLIVALPDGLNVSAQSVP